MSGRAVPQAARYLGYVLKIQGLFWLVPPIGLQLGGPKKSLFRTRLESNSIFRRRCVRERRSLPAGTTARRAYLGAHHSNLQLVGAIKEAGWRTMKNEEPFPCAGACDRAGQRINGRFLFLQMVCWRILLVPVPRFAN